MSEHPEFLSLQLGEFEGPLDLLLQLARDQKVDLHYISMAELCDQYLEFLDKTVTKRLDLASEYLVMASFLTYLKSQILLPVIDKETEETINQTRLALIQLQEIQKLSGQLHDLPQQGRDFFTRGMGQPLSVVKKSLFLADINELILAYSLVHSRYSGKILNINPTRLESTEIALKRIESLLPHLKNWITLDDSIGQKYPSTIEARSALAASLCALLELTRDARTEIRQAQFHDILEFRAYQTTDHG